MNQERLSISMAIIATAVSATVIFMERALPFILFNKKQPPAFIRFIEKYIPPMVMSALLFYCLKDIQFSSPVSGIPTFAALAITVILHIWKRNSLISIFSGTAAFMLIQHFM